MQQSADKGVKAIFEAMMNMNKTLNEQISLFADGELESGQQDAILKALREPAARAAWDVYHHVGDAIRSADTATDLSSDFSARMAARLAAEPVHLGAVQASQPATPVPQVPAANASQGNQAWRRFGIPGVAVAATLLLAVVAGPQLSGSHDSPSELAAHAIKPGIAAATAGAAPAVVRDARMDTYLLAHQRFSPSLYSTAQFARSYTFATESTK